MNLSQAYARAARVRAATGLSVPEYFALVATVAAYEGDGFPVCRSFITKLVERNVKDPPSDAGDGLVELFRKGLLADWGAVGSTNFYVPTSHAIAMVRGWRSDGRGEVAATETAAE